MNVTSAIHEMEMDRLDQELEKTRKQFYGALLEKKRRVKRKWLEISAMTNAHLLQTLPYRAMLGHVAQLAQERDKLIAEILTSSAETITKEESDNTTGQGADKDDEVAQETDAINDQEPIAHRSARDEAIQTEESSFTAQS